MRDGANVEEGATLGLLLFVQGRRCFPRPRGVCGVCISRTLVFRLC